MPSARTFAVPALIAALGLTGCGGGNTAPTTSITTSNAATGSPSGSVPTATAGPQTGITLPDAATNVPPVTVKVPGWNLTVTLTPASQTATGPTGTLAPPKGGAFIGVRPTWAGSVFGEGGQNTDGATTPSYGNALDPKAGKALITQKLTAPAGVTISVQSGGRTYPLAVNGQQTVLALPAATAQSTLTVAFQGRTQSVNLATGQRTPNPATDALYAETPFKDIQCPPVMTSGNTSVTGTCDVFTYPVAWSATNGWAPAGHV